MTARIQQRDAAALAAGYSRSHRALEIFGITAFTLLGGSLALRIGQQTTTHNVWLIPVGVMVGFVAADLFSGLVHWFCDTWGSVETPLIGRLFIRTFREHHVDQESITRHDFIETNGDNCLVASPVLALALLIPVDATSPYWFFSATFMLALTFFVFMTSQIHKWAHMKSPPGAVAALQRARVILGREHHSKHHAAPFDRHYCITAGWLNEPLMQVQFFRTLERMITATTGALPRRDDIGVDAATKVAEDHGVLADSGVPTEKPVGSPGR